MSYWRGIGILAATLVAAAWGALPAPASGRPPVLAAAAPRQALPAQRLNRPPRGATVVLDSQHFSIVYRPQRITNAQADEARRVAEQGWERCQKLFGSEPDYKLRLDLSPEFVGATGFARPGNPRATDPDEQPMIGIRYADLDYLGLPPEYVFTHEIGHIFSGKLAGTALGEGIADWSAGNFSGVPMQPWWGKALREAGLWIEPDAFFITGDFPANPEVDAVIRTSQYAESALLVRYLVDRYGWERFRSFAEEYGRARGRLDSNEDRRRLRLPRDFRPEGKERDPRLPPTASDVRAVFQKHFEASWDQIRANWERSIEAEPAPREQAERLVLAHRVYGAIRNWEMWLLAQKPAPAEEAQESVRTAFTRANDAVRRGDLAEGARALGAAQRLVEAIRRPPSIAKR